MQNLNRTLSLSRRIDFEVVTNRAFTRCLYFSLHDFFIGL